MTAVLGEVLYAAAAVSAFGALLTSFCGSNKAMIPLIRYVLSLFLTLMLLTPLLSVIRGAAGLLTDGDVPDPPELPLFRETEDFCGDAAASLAVSSAENVTVRLLRLKTGIPENCLHPELRTKKEDGLLLAVSAQIIVEGAQYRILSDKVRLYAEELLGCPCTVKTIGKQTAEETKEAE